MRKTRDKKVKISAQYKRGVKMTLWLKNTIQNELAEIASAETVKRNTTLKSDYIYYLQSKLRQISPKKPR